MKDALSLVKHKTVESEKVLDAINDWINICNSNSGDFESFAAVIVSKDGGVDTYYEALNSRANLTLIGGIEALKIEIVKDNFNFLGNVK